jgi:hypothetical protein
MSKTATAPKTIAETIDATFCTVDSAKLFNKGFERVIEAGKATLDLAAAQNADILDICKKALSSTQAPVFMLDLAGEALTGQLTLQKSLLDMAALQTASITEAAQELLQEPAKAQAGIAKLFQQSMDRTVAAHDSVLEYAAAQAKSVNSTVKAQPNVAGSPVETLADSIQRGVETAIATQKEILANAAKASKNAVAKA